MFWPQLLSVVVNYTLTILGSTVGSLSVPGTRVQYPAWVTVCAESAHSPHVCVGFLRVLQFPPTVR